MTDSPFSPEDPDGDPFEGLPDELRQMMEQMGGSGMFAQLQGMLSQQGTGPVNWDLARQIALRQIGTGDRSPSPEEVTRAQDAFRVAEHWLDATSLPAPPDAGQLVVASRSDWVDAALRSMRPLVEPVAMASSQAMSELAQEQMKDVDLDEMGLGSLSGLLGGIDMNALSGMLNPIGAMLTGMQAGQVLGELAGQMLGQYDLGIPTAGRATAYFVALNIDETFGAWDDLDPTEVAIAVSLMEAAQRRLYHAVPWLEAHIHGLVAQFANGAEVDPEQLAELSQELMLGVDPEDPESLQAALERAREIRIEPTPQQQRVLERIQGVISLVQAWARQESHRAAGDRLPNLDRIDEVLRRRRATKGDGEQLLAQLLGLDLTHPDDTLGERFVAAVEQAQGRDGLHNALAHPENLPDADELADPAQWLVRMTAAADVPDDAAAIFDGLGDAPVERSADERLASPNDETDEDGPQPA